MKMKRSLLLAVWALAVLSLCGAAGLAEASVDVAVDGNQTHQEIHGFGTCLAHWLSEPYNWQSFREMYAQDLGCSILRINLEPRALIKDHMKQTTTFSADINENISKMDFTVFHVGDPFGQFAQAIDQLKLDELSVIGSFWTPPHFMKTDSRSPDTTYDKTKSPWESCGGHLIATEDNYVQFARYTAAWIKGWELEWGVPLDVVSVQNEPYFYTDYSSCVYYSSYGPTEGGPAVDEFTGPIKAIQAELDANSLPTKLQAPEHLLYENNWKDGLDYQFGYVQDIRNDPTAASAIDGWAIHSYEPAATVREARQRVQWDRYYNGVDEWAGISTDGYSCNYQTEGGVHENAWTATTDERGEEGALAIGTEIHEALVIGNQNAWLYWQTAGEVNGEVGVYELTDGDDTTQPKYKAFKHFSRYIRPGSVRVEASPDKSDKVLTSAYLKGSTGTVVVEVVNCNTTDQTVNVTLTNLPSISDFHAYRSTEDENHHPVGPYTVSGGVVSFSSPAESIVTLVGSSQGDTTAPAAPTGLTATSTGSGQIDLDWADNTEPDLEYYRIYRATTSGGPYDWVAGAWESSYSDTGLAGSTTYYYVVTAVDSSANESAESSQASATTPDDTTAPAAPTNLTAAAIGASQVDLDWDDNTEPDLASYNVYRDGAQIATGVTYSQYSDTGVSPATQYCYTVTAVDTTGNESADSTQACATTLQIDATIMGTTSAPTVDGSVDAVWSDANCYSIGNSLSGTTGGDDLSGQWRALWDGSNLYYLVEVTDESLVNDSGAAWDDDSVEIYMDGDDSKGTSYDGVNDFQWAFRWNDGTVHVGTNSVDDTTGIVFEMLSVSGGYNCEISIPWATVGVVPTEGNTVGTDVHLNDDDDGSSRDGKMAWYATTDDSWSDPSTFGTAALGTGAGPGDTTPPAAPTNLTATGVSPGQIDLDWDDNAEPDLASYNVYRDTAQIATGVATSSYTDTGLSSSTQYCYTVTAVDTSANESSESNQACATTQEGDTTPPAAPTNLTATAVSSSQIDLDWDENAEPDLDSYNVYRDSVQIATGVTLSNYSDTGLGPSTQYCYTVTAVDTSNNESADSNQACATTQEGATSCHVDSIVLSHTEPIRGKKRGKAEVTVVDDAGAPVANATVTGTFAGGSYYVGTESATTNANGLALLVTDGTCSGGCPFSFCVDDVTHATLTYNSADNVETCDSL